MPVLYPKSKFVGNAFVSGNLYDMGGYPAVVLDENAGPIAGEVYTIDDETLKALDEFEASADYTRNLVELTLNGETLPGWIYSPEPDICSGKDLIESGDWIKYVETKL